MVDQNLQVLFWIWRPSNSTLLPAAADKRFLALVLQNVAVKFLMIKLVYPAMNTAKVPKTLTCIVTETFLIITLETR